MKYKPKTLKLLRCDCGAMNHLSKVRHGDNWQVCYAEVECSESGFKKTYEAKK